MTRDEALRVATILLKADNDCWDCGAALGSEAQRAFPEFDWMELIAEVEPKFFFAGPNEPYSDERMESLRRYFRTGSAWPK